MLNIKNTELKYLQDAALFIAEAFVLAVSDTETGRAVILDATIFYPQGGGQPSDTGKIYTGRDIFKVSHVRLDQNGVVWHFGTFVAESFVPDEKVTLEIDEAKRILHNKLHSAGHLIDCAIEKLAMPNLQPVKGFHFPEGANVEYQGIVENSAALVIELQKTVDELLVQDLPLEIHDLSLTEAAAKGIVAPLGKQARVVNFSGFSACGCGGTHAMSSSQIGKILIKKIKSKKGTTKISYEVL